MPPSCQWRAKCEPSWSQDLHPPPSPPAPPRLFVSRSPAEQFATRGAGSPSPHGSDCRDHRDRDPKPCPSLCLALLVCPSIYSLYTHPQGPTGRRTAPRNGRPGPDWWDRGRMGPAGPLLGCTQALWLCPSLPLNGDRLSGSGAVVRSWRFLGTVWD